MTEVSDFDVFCYFALGTCLEIMYITVYEMTHLHAIIRTPHDLYFMLGTFRPYVVRCHALNCFRLDFDNTPNYFSTYCSALA